MGRGTRGCPLGMPTASITCSQTAVEGQKRAPPQGSHSLRMVSARGLMVRVSLGCEPGTTGSGSRRSGPWLREPRTRRSSSSPNARSCSLRAPTMVRPSTPAWDRRRSSAACSSPSTAGPQRCPTAPDQLAAVRAGLTLLDARIAALPGPDGQPSAGQPCRLPSPPETTVRARTAAPSRSASSSHRQGDLGFGRDHPGRVDLRRAYGVAARGYSHRVCRTAQRALGVVSAEQTADGRRLQEPTTSRSARWSSTSWCSPLPTDGANMPVKLADTAAAARACSSMARDNFRSAPSGGSGEWDPGRERRGRGSSDRPDRAAGCQARSHRAGGNAADADEHVLALRATRNLVEAETRRILDECYTRALEKLRENRAPLDRLAEALVEHETLDELEAYRVAGLERTERPTTGQLPATVSASGRDIGESGVRSSPTRASSYRPHGGVESTCTRAASCAIDAPPSPVRKHVTREISARALDPVSGLGHALTECGIDRPGRWPIARPRFTRLGPGSPAEAY